MPQWPVLWSGSTDAFQCKFPFVCVCVCVCSIWQMVDGGPVDEVNGGGGEVVFGRRIWHAMMIGRFVLHHKAWTYYFTMCLPSMTYVRASQHPLQQDRPSDHPAESHL